MNPLKLSLCVVALNEEEFLPSLLEDLRKQEYPHGLTEIVLVDSGSRDKTKEIMKSFASEKNDFYSVQVLDNPQKIQASGWNIAITHATGDVISRIDAHTSVPSQFSKLVMNHIKNGEDVVGGIRPCIIEKETSWAKTLLAVENSLFGSSINSSRHSKEVSYVKTMFHASYRREVFEKVGLFNEELLRTEDNEMHYRIRKAGYRLLYDPEIVSYQYARSSLARMIKQKYGNGYWVGVTLGICPKCISLYHLIPAAFVLAIIVTSILLACRIWQFAVVMWILYAMFTILSTVVALVEYGFSLYMLLMPFLFHRLPNGCQNIEMQKANYLTIK